VSHGSSGTAAGVKPWPFDPQRPPDPTDGDVRPGPTDRKRSIVYRGTVNLQFLGGTGEVGRSAVLVNDRLLLDYGLKTGTPLQHPIDCDPEAVVVSHGHLDHAGAVPGLLSGRARPPVHWTPPTAELARLLARDTLKLHGNTPQCPFTEEALKRLGEVSRRQGYREPFEAAGHRVTFFDAGHVPGSAHVLVDDGETRLLYTGDFYAVDAPAGDGGSTADRGESAAARTDRAGRPLRGQRLVVPTATRPDADVVITESTYADVDHDDRAAVERRFVDRVERTLWDGGTVVVPAFAIGRTQELMLVCAAHDIPCYVDGMGTRVTDILRRHDGFVRDPAALNRAARHARTVDGRAGQRRRIADQPAAIVTTAGMLGGGPVQRYLREIRSDPTDLVAFTGYQVEGTPGRELLETGRTEIDGRVLPVSAGVEAFDFSAHADRNGLRGFLSAYRDAKLLVVHGDRTGWFADELADAGHDASAPGHGERVTV